LLEHVARIEDNIAEYDRILSRMAKTDHRSQRLMELKGVGPTTACALVASISNAHDFKNGRQLAAAGTDTIAVRQRRKVEATG
jgi:transposase